MMMIKQSLKLIWRRKGSNGLLVLEFFLTFLVLFVTSVLIFDGIHRYLMPDGFDIDNVISIVAYRGQYTGGSESNENPFPQFANTLKDIPSVQSVGLMGREMYDRRLVGDRLTIHGTTITFSSTVLSDASKNILSIDLVQGRWFSAEDDAGQYDPIIINTQFRDEAFDGISPLGAVIGDTWKVVGVISDLKIFGEFDKPQSLLIERTTLDNPGRMHTIIAKLTTESTGELIATILAALQVTAPDWTFIITSAEELRATRINDEATPYVVAGMTTVLLIAMVILGLFGVLWQNITRRTREIGLRRAKGASIGDIYAQIIGEMLLIATIGVVPGILIVMQLVIIDMIGFTSLVTQVIAIGFAVVFLYLMVTVCSLYPGYLATRINPAQALHYE